MISTGVDLQVTVTSQRERLATTSSASKSLHEATTGRRVELRQCRELNLSDLDLGQTYCD